MTEANPKHRIGRRHFQFSVRMLLFITAVAAVAVAIYVKAHRDRTARRRPVLFIQALHKGDFAEVDRLLKIDPKLAHGVQHGGNSFSHTPLQLALGKPQIFNRILEERPDLDERSSNGRTALDIAVTQNMVLVIQRLLRLGADPNALDDEGRTCLHDAAEYDRTGQITKLLLEAGADPNNASNPEDAMLDAKSPLHRAAERGHDIIVTHLLHAGAQVNLPDISGRTALHFAVAADRSKLASLLIEHGADLTAKDKDGLIPGQHADDTNSDTAAEIWWEQIAMLVEKGEIAALDQMLNAAPQALSFRTEYLTMLGRALSNRRLDMLDYLLDRHAEPEVRRRHANSHLHWACRNSSVDFVKRLFDAGADIKAKNENGQTPLHAAANGHNHDVIRLLLAKGAEIDTRDNAGATPIDAAFESHFHNDQQTLAILRQAGHAPTVLYAAATGDVDLLDKLTGGDRELLDRGYNRNEIRSLHGRHGQAALRRQMVTGSGRRTEPAASQAQDVRFSIYTPHGGNQQQRRGHRKVAN